MDEAPTPAMPVAPSAPLTPVAGPSDHQGGWERIADRMRRRRGTEAPREVSAHGVDDKEAMSESTAPTEIMVDRVEPVLRSKREHEKGRLDEREHETEGLEEREREKED